MKNSYLGALQIHVIISDLEIYPDHVYERNIVSGKREGDQVSRMGSGGNFEEMYILVFVVEQAIMSLIPIRRRPPVSDVYSVLCSRSDNVV